MRYFIVFFDWRGYSDLNSRLVSGGFSVAVKSKKFINAKSEMSGAERLLKKHHQVQATQVYISNILEVNEQDYLDFTAEGE